jgi:hypothetical protein
MSHGRVAAGCSHLIGGGLGFGVACLPLIGLVALAGWGAILLVTADAVHPVRTTGIVAETVDVFQGNTYESTHIRLTGDKKSYEVYFPGLHPPLPHAHPQAGEPITLWFDPDTNWVNLTETHVLAVSLADESADRAAHRREDFENPESAGVRQRLVGAGLLGLVAVIVGVSALWERFLGRRPAGSSSAVRE